MKGSAPRQWHVRLAVSAVLLSIGVTAAQAQPGPIGPLVSMLDYTFDRAWGGPYLALKSAADVALAKDGTVYLLDADASMVHLYSADATYLRSIGGPGAAAGQLRDPMGMIWGPDGDLFVADTGNNRIQRFHPDGTFVAQYGEVGAEMEQLRGPAAVAVGPDGTFYVLEVGNQRVQKLNANWQFQGYLLNHGEMYRPSDLKLLADGSLVVAAQAIAQRGGCLLVRANGEVAPLGFEAFHFGLGADGKTLHYSHRGVLYTYADGRSTPFFDFRGMVASGVPARRLEDKNMLFAGTYGDAAGCLFACANNRQNKLAGIVKLSREAKQLVSFDDGQNAPGHFKAPASIAHLPAGGFAVADPRNGRVTLFAADGARSGLLTGAKDGDFEAPKAVAALPSGDLVVIDRGVAMVLAPDGRRIRLLPGQYADMVAVDGVGRIHLVEKITCQIQVFDAVGTLKAAYGGRGYADGLFVPGVTAIAVDKDGFVYVTDKPDARSRIQKFDPAGKFVGRFPVHYDTANRPQSAELLATSSTGDLLVTDGTEKAVYVMDPDFGVRAVIKPELPADQGLMAVAGDAKGGVLVGVSDGRVLRYVPKAGR